MNRIGSDHGWVAYTGRNEWQLNRHPAFAFAQVRECVVLDVIVKFTSDAYGYFHQTRIPGE